MEDRGMQQRLWILSLLLLSLVMVWGSQASSTPAPVPLSRPCSFFSGKTCEECLKNVSCLWCITNSSCQDYPVRTVFPPSSLCAMSRARWGACWINFEALIIAMSVVLGVILLCVFVCCCYCCYCRKSSSSRLRLEAEEENLLREREKRKQLSDERKNKRTIKHNEIRKKYGPDLAEDLSKSEHLNDITKLMSIHHLICLLQDMDHPYSKFDDE